MSTENEEAKTDTAITDQAATLAQEEPIKPDDREGAFVNAVRALLLHSAHVSPILAAAKARFDAAFPEKKPEPEGEDNA
jgi:hypothetical protein